MTRKERIPWYERPYGLDRLVHISAVSLNFADRGMGMRCAGLSSALRPTRLPPCHCSTWSPPQQIAEKIQSAGGPGEQAKCVHARSLYAYWLTP